MFMSKDSHNNDKTKKKDLYHNDGNVRGGAEEFVNYDDDFDVKEKNDGPPPKWKTSKRFTESEKTYKAGSHARDYLGIMPSS